VDEVETVVLGEQVEPEGQAERPITTLHQGVTEAAPIRKTAGVEALAGPEAMVARAVTEQEEEEAQASVL